MHEPGPPHGSPGTLLVADYYLGVAQFTFIGEVLFMFWLLWKGIRGLETGAVQD